MVDGITQSASADYETRLSQDTRWALSEGSRHFDEQSAVHATLRRICGHLNELRVPYAVAGGMALFRHGYRRFTEDVDILIARNDLKRVHERLGGRGYVPLFLGSKNLRDTESKVRIEFLLTGDYPGDGKQKPVAFPDPSDVAETRDGICFANLPAVVELKIASGMTGSDRMKDLADVQELIKRLSLPADFADQLSPYVQPKYHELWQATTSAKRRYIRLWRHEATTAPLGDIDKLIAVSGKDAAAQLLQMRDDGVTLELGTRTVGDCACLVTTDPEVARKYDMHDEAEYWSDPEDADAGGLRDA